ncbi:MAG TPA: RusA family crossover junction endodeoxyribonuclease [Zeimonas sp.]
MIELRLPWAPSTNTIWRSMRSGPMAGRVLLSKAGREFFAQAEREVLVQRAGRRIAGRAQVEIVLHAPTRAQLDIDNRAKAVLDACTKGGLWADDSQVDVLIVRRACVLKGGAVLVRAIEIEAAPEQAELAIREREPEFF